VQKFCRVSTTIIVYANSFAYDLLSNCLFAKDLIAYINYVMAVKKNILFWCKCHCHLHRNHETHDIRNENPLGPIDRIIDPGDPLCRLYFVALLLANGKFTLATCLLSIRGKFLAYFSLHIRGVRCKNAKELNSCDDTVYF